jgi:hypothetical protein
MICTECGAYLGNKQIAYEEDMKNIAQKFNVSDESLSRWNVENNEEYENEKSAVVLKYCKRYCCTMKLMNYSRLVNIVSG